MNNQNWHKFQIDDIRVLLDVNSASLYVIDELMWDLLEVWNPGDLGDSLEPLIEKYPEEQVEEALRDLETLRQEGLFACEDTFKDIYNPQGGMVKALCLNVAHECNLRCGYCFAGTGSFGGQRGLMSPQVGKDSVDFLIANSGKRKNLEIDFFGGEPLLNMETIREVVLYGNQKAQVAGKNLRFTITTNGVLLDREVEEFLSAHNIRAVLSLDGRPEVNDRMRHFPNGKGTYEKIVPRIKHFTNSYPELYYSVRGTYTRYNLDFTEDAEHLLSLGFDKISLEPVVGGPEEPYSLRWEDVPRIEEEYERLTRFYLSAHEAGTPFSFFHFNVDLDGGPCLPKRLSGCGAGNEYLAVTPQGELYPCHQFIGREEFLLGSVSDGLQRPDICDTFRQAHVYNKPQCAKCWARFYCGGGCHANAHLANGDIFKPYEIGCALMKKRLECALLIKVKLLMENGA